MRLVLSLLSLVLLAAIATHVARADEAGDLRTQALAAVRGAVSVRDMAAAKEKLAAAAKLKGEAQFDAEYARLLELTGYVEKFWQSVDQAAKSLDATQELMIGDQIVSVVEYENGTLVLRVAGQNRRYTYRDVPPKVALTLAEQVLLPNAPENKVFFGAFLCLDAKGDRTKARQLWDDAARAKIDIAHLLPELGAEPPAPPVEIPPVSIAMRANLDEKNWTLRTLGEKGWVRKTNVTFAQQNAAGRLEINVPSAAGERTQVIARRQFAGDFTATVIVSGLKKAQTFGLLAADSSDEGYVVSLPAGTALLQFVRQGSEVKCRVNQKDVEVEVVGKPTARMTGFLGLGVAGGDDLVIEAIEFSGR